MSQATKRALLFDYQIYAEATSTELSRGLQPACSLNGTFLFHSLSGETSDRDAVNLALRDLMKNSSLAQYSRISAKFQLTPFQKGGA